MRPSGMAFRPGASQGDQPADARNVGRTGVGGGSWIPHVNGSAPGAGRIGRTFVCGRAARSVLRAEPDRRRAGMRAEPDIRALTRRSLSSVVVGRCRVVAICTRGRGRCAGLGRDEEAQVAARGGRRSVVTPGLDRELVSGGRGAGPQKRLSARGRSKRLNLEPGVTAARPEKLYPPRAERSDEFASCEREAGPRVSSGGRSPVGGRRSAVPPSSARRRPARAALAPALSRGCRRATGGRRRRGRPRAR